MFLGSEGTLGVFTRITLRVRPIPPTHAHAAYGFDSFADGLDAVRRILRRGARPAVVRLYDAEESGRHFDASESVLIVLAEGEDEVAWELRVVAEECARELDASLVGRWLEHRNDVSALDHAVASGLVVDTIETVALWRDVRTTYDEVRAAIAAVPATLAVTAHCSTPTRPARASTSRSPAHPSRPKRTRTTPPCGTPPSPRAPRSPTITASGCSGARGDSGRRGPPGAEGRTRSGGTLNPGKLGFADRLGTGEAPWPPR